MALFKKAYAHGVCKALIDTKAVKFASEEIAAEAADAASETLPEEPIEAVAPEQTAELAANLVELSNSLQESADNAAQAADAAAKTGSVHKAAARLRAKLAEGTGSTITGTKPEQQNTVQNAETTEAKMDEAQRPEGYANVGEDGVGSQQDSGRGAVGEEEDRDAAQGTGMGPKGEDGTNSAEEAKSASLRRVIAAAAKHASTTVGVGGAAPDMDTGEGKLDDQNRPGGKAYANKGSDQVGQTDEKVPAVARIGKEEPNNASGGMGPVGTGGTNTVIQETKVGEDEEYMQRFRSLGQKVASKLPFYFTSHQKVAAIQYLMGLPPSEQNRVVGQIEKTAEVPEALKAYVAKSEGDNGEEEEESEEEEKTEEKGEEKEEKKEAAQADILRRLRRLQAR
jgi:hypothetical protein